MKKLFVAAMAALMVVGAGGVAQAGHENTDGPGPNGHNNKGLCTAYFNGQKNGHGKDGKDSPPPFKALEDAADEANDNDGNDDNNDQSTVENVFEYCQEAGIGGQPEHGRYNCIINEDGAPECTENGPPGKSGE